MLFGAGGSFRTIDGGKYTISCPSLTHTHLTFIPISGMNLLPNAFHPIVDDITTFGAKVEKIQFDEKTSRLKLHWRGNYTETKLESQSFDYAILSPTIPAVQRMRLPGKHHAFPHLQIGRFTA
jgi:hypothetical protein